MRRLRTLALGAGIFCLLFWYSVPAPAQGVHTDDNSDAADSQAAVGDIGMGRRLSYSVRGTVVDGDTGQLLGGIRVELSQWGGSPVASTQTDNIGNFGFDGVRSGSYLVQVKLNGYATYSERLDLVMGPALPIRAELHKSVEKAAAGSSQIVTVRDLAIPAKARDSMNQGMQLLAKSDYSGSVKAFQKAIDAYPNYYEAYTKMGLAYMAMKDDKRSETALRKSLELSDQKDAEALVYLAKLQSDKGSYSDAEASARKAVDLDGKSWATNLELARALYGEKQYPDAEKYAQLSEQSGPDHPDVYLLLINIHYFLNNGKAALDEMNTFLKLVPSGPMADQVRTARGKLQKQLVSEQTAPAQDPNAPSLRK